MVFQIRFWHIDALSQYDHSLESQTVSDFRLDSQRMENKLLNYQKALTLSYRVMGTLTAHVLLSRHYVYPHIENKFFVQLEAFHTGRPVSSLIGATPHLNFAYALLCRRGKIVDIYVSVS